MITSTGLRVLVAEDSRTQARRAKLVLEDAGLSVTVARDGLDAWEKLGAEPFDIVVSDIHMPGIDGFELCRRSKADLRLQTVPFVLLTAEGDLAALVRGLEAGADDFITKPWMPAALQARINAVLGAPARAMGAATGAALGRMTSLLLARTLEFELVHRAQAEHGAELSAANESLATERLALKDTSEQLKAASEAKSDFLANMSHELRTPLSAILGFSDLLLKGPEGHYDRETQVKFLTCINEAGRHVLGLINDILDLSKVEAGQMVLRPAQIELAGLIQEVMATVAPLAATKGINLVTDVTEGDVVADPVKLRQILFNLVSNAIKFTPSGGHVTVNNRWSEREVIISISDDGIGLDADDMTHVFEEFWQAEKSATGVAPGTGLGLPLTRKLVELHDGRIGVVSNPGKGSTFTVALQLRHALLDLSDDPSGHDMNDKSFVLVAEADRATAYLMSRYIRGAGYGVKVIRNGADVLRTARLLKPRFITLSLLLPNTDGWALLSALKRDPETAGIPVVVVTVVDEPGIALARGADAYLLKPVSSSTILNVLAKLEAESAAPLSGNGVPAC